MDIDSEHRKETSEEKAEKRRKRKSKMTIFSKISVFLLIVSCIMLLVFLGTRHMIAMIASVVQIAGILIALLFHKKILKSERKWLNRGTILLAVILLMAANIALSIRAYTHSRDSSSANEEVQSTSQNSAELIRMPLGTDDCIGQSYSDVYRELKDAGFTNVDCLAMEDLSFEETEQVGTVLSVRIGSETGFVQDQEYAKDSIILVYYHDYKKCNLTVSIKFDGNLLFNKDDVDLYLNDSLKGTLEHGKDAEFSFREKTGEIVLRFEKTDDAEVSQEYTLNLTSDTDLTLEISCDKQGVYIEEKSIEESENDTDAEDGADSITRSQTDDVAEEAEE
ncbi:MAG: O-antigen ligase family protein [Lachnospiraceae bacterium]|nr:O-antigen ligase family protein [Lachnospiraceae bacterium]